MLTKKDLEEMRRELDESARPDIWFWSVRGDIYEELLDIALAVHGVGVLEREVDIKVMYRPEECPRCKGPHVSTLKGGLRGCSSGGTTLHADDCTVFICKHGVNTRTQDCEECLAEECCPHGVSWHAFCDECAREEEE